MGRIGEPKREIHIPVPVPSQPATPVEAPEPGPDPVTEPAPVIEPVPTGG